MKLFAFACALSVGFAAPSTINKQTSRFAHPIQKLLVSYQSSIPPVAAILATGKSEGAVEAALELLRSPSARQSWPGAIIAIGILGNPDDTRLIQELIVFQEDGCLPATIGGSPCPKRQRLPAVTRHWQEEARIVVPLSLGYLLRRSSDETAGLILQKLFDATGPDYCREKVTWTGSPDNSQTRGIELQLNAIQALRLSGKPEAKDELKRVLKTNQNPLVLQEATYAIESFPETARR